MNLPRQLTSPSPRASSALVSPGEPWIRPDTKEQRQKMEAEITRHSRVSPLICQHIFHPCARQIMNNSRRMCATALGTEQFVQGGQASMIHDMIHDPWNMT